VQRVIAELMAGRLAKGSGGGGGGTCVFIESSRRLGVECRTVERALLGRDVSFYCHFHSVNFKRRWTGLCDIYVR